jgi:hypothetical protein
MKFNRTEFYGLDFSWFVVDMNGYIAKLTTGYGPIPKAIFQDENNYIILFKYFDELPIITNGILTREYQNKQNNGIGNYNYFVNETKQGLFSYNYSDYDGSYELITFPGSPLNINNIPDNIRTLLSLAICSYINFNSSYKLIIEEYFICD